MMTREQFLDTNWKSSYEEYKKFDCTQCNRENCIHRNAFRRVPEIDGGLGLCPNLKKPERMHDRELEELWNEFEDVTCVEAKDFYADDEDYKDDISLVLASDWNDFPAGTSVESVWHWFDERHSKGVGWLLGGDADQL